MQINESVKSLKENFWNPRIKIKKSFKFKDKLRELENILNESNYIDVQPSLFDVYDSEVNVEIVLLEL